MADFGGEDIFPVVWLAPWDIDRDDGVFIKTKVGIEHITDLPAYHQGADDKEQAHRKLENNKTLAEIAFGVELPDTLPLKADYRQERRECPAGIPAGDQTSDQGRSPYKEPGIGVGHTQPHALGDKAMQGCNNRIGEQECECHGDHDDDAGFDEELSDKTAAAAAHYFPDAYLLCAQYGLRRRQVDEVDSGNDQDEEGNAGKCKQRRLMRPAAVG